MGSLRRDDGAGRGDGRGGTPSNSLSSTVPSEITDWVSKGLTSLEGSSFSSADMRIVREGGLDGGAEELVGRFDADRMGLGGKTAMRGSEG